jgi:hypothetical protein
VNAKLTMLITLSALVVVTGFAIGAWWSFFLTGAGMLSLYYLYRTAARRDGITSIMDLMIDPDVFTNYFGK